MGGLGRDGGRGEGLLGVGEGRLVRGRKGHEKREMGQTVQNPTNMLLSFML